MRVCRTFHRMNHVQTVGRRFREDTDSFEPPEVGASLLFVQTDEHGCYCWWRIDEHETSPGVARINDRARINERAREQGHPSGATYSMGAPSPVVPLRPRRRRWRRRQS